MPSINKLFTRAAAEAGQVLQLNGPDGKPCGEWIKVRGVDSQHLSRAQRTFRRLLLAELDAHDKAWRGSEEYIQFTDTENQKLRAAVVMEWSFDEECTPENIVELFTQAPYIGDQVDEFSGKREMFVGSSSTNSGHSPDSKLSSPSPSGSTENPEPLSGSISNKLAEAGAEGTTS